MAGKVLIIGAGLTGLSTAFHLEKRGGIDYSIYEKREKVGGKISISGKYIRFTTRSGERMCLRIY